MQKLNSNNLDVGGGLFSDNDDAIMHNIPNLSKDNSVNPSGDEKRDNSKLYGKAYNNFSELKWKGFRERRKIFFPIIHIIVLLFWTSYLLAPKPKDSSYFEKEKYPLMTFLHEVKIFFPIGHIIWFVSYMVYFEVTIDSRIGLYFLKLSLNVLMIFSVIEWLTSKDCAHIWLSLGFIGGVAFQQLGASLSYTLSFLLMVIFLSYHIYKDPSTYHLAFIVICLPCLLIQFMSSVINDFEQFKRNSWSVTSQNGWILRPEIKSIINIIQDHVNVLIKMNQPYAQNILYEPLDEQQRRSDIIERKSYTIKHIVTNEVRTLDGFQYQLYLNGTLTNSDDKDINNWILTDGSDSSQFNGNNESVTTNMQYRRSRSALNNSFAMENSQAISFNWYKILACAHELRRIGVSLLQSAVDDQEKKINSTPSSLAGNGPSTLMRVKSLESEITETSDLSLHHTKSISSDTEAHDHDENQNIRASSTFYLESICLETFACIECLHSSSLALFMCDGVNSISGTKLDLSGYRDRIRIEGKEEVFRYVLFLLTRQSIHQKNKRVIYSVSLLRNDFELNSKDYNADTDGYRLYFKETILAPKPSWVLRTIFASSWIQDPDVDLYSLSWLVLLGMIILSVMKYIVKFIKTIDKTTSQASALNGDTFRDQPSTFNRLLKMTLPNENFGGSWCAASQIAKRIIERHFKCSNGLKFYPAQQGLEGLITLHKAVHVPAHMIEFVRFSLGQNSSEPFDVDTSGQNSDKSTSDTSSDKLFDDPVLHVDDDLGLSWSRVKPDADSYDLKTTVKTSRSGKVLSKTEVYSNAELHCSKTSNDDSTKTPPTSLEYFHSYLWVEDDIADLPEESIFLKNRFYQITDQEARCCAPPRLKTFFSQVGVPLKEARLGEILKFFRVNSTASVLKKEVFNDSVFHQKFEDNGIAGESKKDIVDTDNSEDDVTFSTSVITSHVNIEYDERAICSSTFLVPDWTERGDRSVACTRALKRTFSRLGVKPEQIVVVSENAEMTREKILSTTRDHLRQKGPCDLSTESSDFQYEPIKEFNAKENASVKGSYYESGIEVRHVLYLHSTDVDFFNLVVNHSLDKSNKTKGSEHKEPSADSADPHDASDNSEQNYLNDFYYFHPKDFIDVLVKERLRGITDFLSVPEASPTVKNMRERKTFDVNGMKIKGSKKVSAPSYSKVKVGVDRAV